MEDQVADFIVNAKKTTASAIQQTKIKISTFMKQISEDSFALIWNIMPYVLL